MANKIQIKRGPAASLPTLDVGELGFTTDTKKLYIGASDGNVEMAKVSDIPTVPSAGTGSPQMDGAASAGSATTWSKSDHRHPTDTTRQAKYSSATVTLAVVDWSNSTATKSVSGVTTSNLVQVSPAPASAEAYAAAGIICTTQAADSLTFTCKTTPSAELTVNVVIWN